MSVTLREYLAREQISQVKAAERLGVTRAYLSTIVNGHPPSMTLRYLICLWSGGAVCLEDWPDDDGTGDEHYRRAWR